MGGKSIPKFFATYNMSRSGYYKAKNEGLGPREMNIGARVIISDEAEDEWRLLMEVITAIVDFPDYCLKENIRSAVQLMFPREAIPDAIFDKAWDHAPREREKRALREISRRKVNEQRKAKFAAARATS